MKLTLSGKEFTLRCDMRALANAKRESGININDLDDDPATAGTLVYYMAQSGAKHAGIPFKYNLDNFLGLIDLTDLPALAESVTEMLGGGTEKKS